MSDRCDGDHWPTLGSSGVTAPDWDKFPGAMLDYDFSLRRAIDDDYDFLNTLSLTVAPSGAAELAVSNLYSVDDLVVFTANGGQPRRTYILKFIATMTNGRVFEFVKRLRILPELETDRATPPGSPGFGTAITWVQVPDAPSPSDD